MTGQDRWKGQPTSDRHTSLNTREKQSVSLLGLGMKNQERKGGRHAPKYWCERKKRRKENPKMQEQNRRRNIENNRVPRKVGGPITS